MEDDAIFLDDALKELNAAEDFRVVAKSTDFEAALRDIGRAQPDVVLCDLVLGAKDRSADLYRLKEKMPRTLVVAVTAFYEPDRIFRALLAGADGYLWKSDQERSLTQAIREVSAAGFPLSRGVAQVIRRHLAEQGGLSRRFAFELLSARHRLIVDLICEGYKNREIARRFNTTEDAIKAECKEICGRLGVPNRASAAAAFAQFVRAFTVRRPAA